MEVTLTAKQVTWHNSIQPDPTELAAFVRNTQLLPVDAEFIAQDHHRPEITIRSEYLLLLIHVPVFNKQRRVTTSESLYVVIRDNEVWTLQYTEIMVLTKLWQDFENSSEKQEEYFAEGPTALALHILSAMYASAFVKLERLHKHINIAEDAVFQGNERKMVEEIAILIRDVMDFRKIIRPQRSLFATPPEHPLVSAHLYTQWLRLHSQVNKLWDLLESLSESSSQLGRTNSTLLQYKENELIRFLTYYSILSIPVFILVTPFNPLSGHATLLTDIFYWSVLVVLLLILIIIFVKFRGKRVL